MTEETFVRELERRADDVHGAPLSFDDVRGRARSIRRRRRDDGCRPRSPRGRAAVLAADPVLLAGDGARQSEAPGPGTAVAEPAPRCSTTGSSPCPTAARCRWTSTTAT